MANFWQSSFHENPQWWTDGNNPYTQGSTDNYRQPRQTSPADCASHTAYPIEHSHTVHHPPSSTVALGFDPLIEEINNEIPFYNPSFINEPEENTFYESPMAEQQYNVMQPKEAYDESESQRSSAWLEQSQAWHSIGFEQMAPPRFTSKVIANSPSLQPEGMYYVDQSRRHSYSPMWNTLGNAVNSTISNFTLGFEGAYNNQYPLTSNKNREAMRGRSQSLYVSSGVTAPDITHRRATVGPFGESPMGFISAQREPPTWTIHLLEVPQGTNDELSSFSDTVKKIRDEYPSSKSNANSGKIWSVSTPVSDQLPCNTSFTIHVHIGGLYLPLILTPKAGCLVKHFIRDILHHINQYPPQEGYFLSLCGSDEFLQNENSLVSHENILKANTDVQLWLHKESSLRRKLARTYEDDNSHFNLNEGMDCASTWRVNRQNLSAAIFNYCSQLALLVQRQCPLSTVIREVRTVCSLLSCVETKEIRDAAEALRLASAQSAQLNASYLLYGTLEAAVTNLSRAISHLIYIYSRSFHADFQTASPQSSLNCTKASLDTELNFVLHVGHNIPEEWTKSYKDFSVFCSVTYAGKKLCQVRNSRKVPATKSLFFMITWEEKIIFPLNVKSLPHETMLTIKLYGTSISTRTANILGWTFIPLYQKEWFVHGTILLGLTYGEPPIVTTPGVFDSRFPAHITLQISFPEMEHRFIKPQFEQKSNNSAPTEEYFKHIVKLSQQQPSLLLLPEAEKGFLWFYRSFCSSKNCYLPLVLGSAPGWDPHTVSAIHTVLRDWTFQNPLDALGLLTSSFSDQDVRKAAVQEIDKLSDDDLFEYLPQLVQAVKFDWHLESALVKLLLSRSMQSIRVAHQLHWLLADALNEALYKSRYQRLLGALQVCIGKALNDEFSKEKKLINILIEVAEKVKAAHDSKRQEVLKTELKRLDQLFGEIQVCRLPLDPAMVVTGINGNACSYFTSNAFPLKVSFINEDPLGKDINVIFKGRYLLEKNSKQEVWVLYEAEKGVCTTKAGDDLRQDMIVLQITRIMDRLWLHEGLDMHMVIFKCQSTGKGRGLVQMVPDATTLAKIHMNSGIIGPLKENTIKKWFGHHNPVEASYQKASENFYYSCAGWCVVTFILGVCDRHNDNIMLTKTGHMFHIDFGKFLGHSQKFGSIKRDRAPFIFTSEMEYFITEGGKNPSRFQEFVELCCRAYNIVRKHSHLILNLLDLMLQADLPELNSAQDVKYVYNNLRPWETELEATSTFTRKIKESVECLPVKLNNLIHILAQMAHLHSTKSASQHNSQESSIIRVTDRSIQRATILRFSKTHERLYLVQVLKSNGAVSLTQKAFAEFLELHHQLKNQYPTLYLPAFPSSQNVTSTDLDHKRMQDLNIYLQQMFSGSYELAHNEQVLQFLLDESKSMGFDYLYFAEPGYMSSDQNPEIQVHISHENQKLTILLKHMKNIRMPDGSAPSAHVNVYLLPDPDEISRRKTKTIPKTSNPTYNDIVEYPGIQRLQGRFLKLIVKSKGTFLGAVSIPLSTAPLNEERWYRLGKSPY